MHSPCDFSSWAHVRLASLGIICAKLLSTNSYFFQQNFLDESKGITVAMYFAFLFKLYNYYCKIFCSKWIYFLILSGYRQRKRTEQDAGKTRTRAIIIIIIQGKNDKKKTILLLSWQKLSNKQNEIQGIKRRKKKPYKEKNTVNIQIFVVTIFRVLNFPGD